MSVVDQRNSALAEGRYDNYREDVEERLLRQGNAVATADESYATLIKRYGIANFVFRYSTGSFHALDAKGEELASGVTIKQLLKSLS
ncbi:MAG TPA: hypothetical protein VKN76_05920 [Kiloniellaceae bacterium]|nr:hypothetical protein [Kiloniellaceae bacterium]